MRSSDETLIAALEILSNDIQSEDGVANAAIAEAAIRLRELSDYCSRDKSRDIPVEWIRKYIDSLLDLSRAFDNDSAMQKATLDRGHHALDMLKAFQESQRA